MKRRELEQIHTEALAGLAYEPGSYRGTGLDPANHRLLWTRLLDLKERGIPLPPNRLYHWALGHSMDDEDAHRLAGVAWAVEEFLLPRDLR